MFNDPELEKAYNESKEQFEDVSVMLDKISADINTLSEVLKSQGIGKIMLE